MGERELPRSDKRKQKKSHKKKKKKKKTAKKNCSVDVLARYVESGDGGSKGNAASKASGNTIVRDRDEEWTGSLCANHEKEDDGGEEQVADGKATTPKLRLDSSDSEDQDEESWIEKNKEDLSPPRKRERADCSSSSSVEDLSPPRKSRDENSSSESDSKGNNKTEKPKMMFSGVSAGLKDGKTFATELMEARKIEEGKLTAKQKTLLGAHAETIYRDKSGRKVDMLKEFARAMEKEKLDKEREAALKLDWNLGAKDKEKLKQRKSELEEVRRRKFAVGADDEDLNEQLKGRVRDGDPMSKLISSSSSKRLDGKPLYSGPPAPPNRFGIQPGYRWDGVDRSNGFEKKILNEQAAERARQEERYRFLTSDM